MVCLFLNLLDKKDCPHAQRKSSFGLPDGNPGRALMKLARSIVMEINDRIVVTADHEHGGCDGLVGEGVEWDVMDLN